MKIAIKQRNGMAAALVLLGSSLVHGKFEAEVEGVVPGKWTMDLGAAKQEATEKQLPIMLNFTGSDWCGWCILMERQVFMKKTWSDYAQDHLVMVMLDYPKDESRVPEKYRARNQALQEKYGIDIFPTFLVLASDGETELGRLTAGQDKTPERFRAEFEELLRYSELGVQNFCAGLGEKEAEEYRALFTELKEKEVASEEATKAMELAEIKANSMKGKIVNHKKKMAAFRISQMSEEKRNEYNSLAQRLAEARAELQAWRKTQPEKNQESDQKMKAFQEEIRGLMKEMRNY